LRKETVKRGKKKGGEKGPLRKKKRILWPGPLIAPRRRRKRGGGKKKRGWTSILYNKGVRVEKKQERGGKTANIASKKRNT